MNRRGFTIVELLIVIAIMGILLTLALVNLRGSQVSARDKERVTDVESLSLHLELFYQYGRENSANIGRYPSTGLLTGGVANLTANLRDLDLNSVMAPGITNVTDTLIMAASNDQTIGGTIQPTIDQYVYQPLQKDGTLCTATLQMCSKFNIFYRLEDASTDCPLPTKICRVTSRHQ